MYRLFYTETEITRAEYLSNKVTLVPRGYRDLEDALRAARQLRDTGPVPWEIQGDDGTELDRDKIVRILLERTADLAGPPTVY